MVSGKPQVQECFVHQAKARHNVLFNILIKKHLCFYFFFLGAVLGVRLQLTDGQVYSLEKYCFMLELLYFSRYLLSTSCSDTLGGSCHSVTYAFIKLLCKSEQATEHRS